MWLYQKMRLLGIRPKRCFAMNLHIIPRPLPDSINDGWSKWWGNKKINQLHKMSTSETPRYCVGLEKHDQVPKSWLRAVACCGCFGNFPKVLQEIFVVRNHFQKVHTTCYPSSQVKESDIEWRCQEMDPTFPLGLAGLPACTGIAAYLESEGLDGPKELSLRSAWDDKKSQILHKKTCDYYYMLSHFLNASIVGFHFQEFLGVMSNHSWATWVPVASEVTLISQQL